MEKARKIQGGMRGVDEDYGLLKECRMISHYSNEIGIKDVVIDNKIRTEIRDIENLNSGLRFLSLLEVLIEIYIGIENSDNTGVAEVGLESVLTTNGSRVENVFTKIKKIGLLSNIVLSIEDYFMSGGEADRLCEKIFVITEFTRFSNNISLIRKIGSNYENRSIKSLGETLRKGWTILISYELVRFGLCSYTNKDVSFRPYLISLVENPTFESSLDIKNNIGIYKEMLVRKIDGKKGEDIKNKKIDLNRIINVINGLNSTRYYIDKDILMNIVDKGVEYDYIKEYLSTKENMRNFSFFKVESCNLSILNKGIYLEHQLDTRGRLYVRNIPINYQLSREVRAVIKISGSPDISIIDTIVSMGFYNSTLVSRLNDKDISRIANGLKSVDIYSNFYKRGEIKDLDYIESILIILERIGEMKKKEDSLMDKLMMGIENLIKIKTLDYNELSILFFSKKRVFEGLYIINKLKKGIKNTRITPNMTGYSDASNNVIQIMILKLMIYDEKILEISNIFENNQEYKDIYYMMEEKTKIRVDPEGKHLIDRDLVKSRLMPGVYGKKRNEFIKDELKKNKYYTKLKRDRLVEFYGNFFDMCMVELGSLGKEIEDYLKLCKELGSKQKYRCIGISPYGVPVVLFKEKRLDRQKKLKEMNKLGYEYHKNKDEKIRNKIDRIKKKLDIDEKNYIRKYIKIKMNNIEKIRIRYGKKNNSLESIRNSISASSTHSDDSSVMLGTIEEMKKFGIKGCYIHDSIGCRLINAALVQALFKKSIIKLLETYIENDVFPLDEIQKINPEFILRLKKRREIGKSNIVSIKSNIIKSRGLFR